ncbi:DNA-3-methyladenine glycosylase I [Nocardioides sp.]|uniref:DNA-3-methyladenine glycosylase I n=1 Tax=Nocardioides sp. TaxID=35761 RepID=UPI0035136E31
MEAVIGEDGVARCPWAAAPGLLRDYHDAEWGRGVTGEAAWFERLSLEAFQSGLSWAVVLRKRPAFRAAFAGFDADVVAGFDDVDRDRLLADAGIVRNRAKIEATIANAAAVRELRAEGGLEVHVRAAAPSSWTPVRDTDELPTTCPESVALARDLKRRGFRFVGPTTLHALFEALGLVEAHLVGCFRSPHAPVGAPAAVAP